MKLTLNTQAIELISQRLENEVTSQSGQSKTGPYSASDTAVAVTIPFPKTFTKVPTVTATARIQYNSTNYSAACTISNVTKAGFVATVRSTSGIDRPFSGSYAIVDWVASAPR